MSHSVIENYIHVIFSTKNRDPLIVSGIEKRLYGYISAISQENKTNLITINGTENHIHLLLKLHPTIGLSTLIKEIKSYSTGWLKKEGYPLFSWQEGYGAFSCSKSHIDAVVKYIQNQKEHHKKKSFDQEIENFNKLWGCSWV